MAVIPAWEEEPETAVALAVGLTTVLCDDEEGPLLTVAVVVCEALSALGTADELPAAVPCDEEIGLIAIVDPVWEEPETAVALAVGWATVLCDDERALPVVVLVAVCDALSATEPADEPPVTVPCEAEAELVPIVEPA